ncbi:ABC transporter permease [Microbacterium amylolyticum]|uniref:Spermidine/putrescine transport system permease protein n=1 Tax=Microbacterium amylolyticum TaxID=936337 RepID=A0ABS4ZEK4_9MICO|nr:ABC transporter permease subunit [Microbacterium amylolyticum]MBP2435420.1 putative spermidine/putrescine transport system permease protein [Microbacterium amylolyticum]
MALLLACFFLLPLLGMAIVAFSVSDGQGGKTLGLENFASLADRGQAIANSVRVSLVGSAVGAGIGAITAFCIAQIRHRRLDDVVAVLSSVLANDGGAPLAFSFIVTIGNTGFLFAALGLDSVGFSLYSWQGLVVMYQYFLIPTMIMVTLPTFVGLRREWHEANKSLGGSAWTFWRRVGIPVAAPALLGGWILLFGSAYATHASAAVLIGTGGFPLVTLTIADELRSGTRAGGEEAAMALGLTMVAIAVVVLFLFNRLQRMSARWLA